MIKKKVLHLNFMRKVQCWSNFSLRLVDSRLIRRNYIILITSEIISFHDYGLILPILLKNGFEVFSCWASWLLMMYHTNSKFSADLFFDHFSGLHTFFLCPIALLMTLSRCKKCMKSNIQSLFNIEARQFKTCQRLKIIKSFLFYY